MAVDHVYRYVRASSYSPATGLELATAGGREDHPYFFRGFVERAGQTARALLAVAEVARSRYFDAGATQRMRDPVVTSNRSVLRTEAFAAGNGVYARFDVDAGGFDVGGATGATDVLRPSASVVGLHSARLTLAVSRDARALNLVALDQLVARAERWARADSAGSARPG